MPTRTRNNKKRSMRKSRKQRARKIRGGGAGDFELEVYDGRDEIYGLGNIIDKQTFKTKDDVNVYLNKTYPNNFYIHLEYQYNKPDGAYYSIQAIKKN